MSGDIFVARGGAVVVLGDRRIVLQEGQTVRAGHPLMEGREHLFEPFTVDFEYDGTTQAAPADTPEPAGGPDPKAVRAWAAENGIEVSPKGKLPASVVEQYLAAHQEA